MINHRSQWTITALELVSIIIPTYNRCQQLLEAIACVRAQTWKNVQLIVVDDGSTDETVARVSCLANVELVTIPHRGQAAARNAGLSRCKGDYVCSLDADDLWNPEFLEDCVRALKTLNVDFVFANWVSQLHSGLKPSYLHSVLHWQREPESELAGWRKLSNERIRTIYTACCPSPSSSVLMKRSICPGWDESVQIGDDWLMILEAAVRHPVQAAFTMAELWVKRVGKDNICDQREPLQVYHLLFRHDIAIMIERLGRHLSGSEKARLYAQICYAELRILRLEPKKFINQLGVVARTVWNGCLCSPRAFLHRLAALSPRFRLGLESLGLRLKLESEGLS